MAMTKAQEALLTALTDQRCVNILEAADFISDLSPAQKAFLQQAEPVTLNFLRTLREEEVRGLQAYLALRSTSWYLAWGIGALVGGLTTILVLWNNIKAYFAVAK